MTQHILVPALGPVMTSTSQISATAPTDASALDAAASRIQAATREAKTSEIEAQALPQFRAEDGATAAPLGELDA